jgi:predicted extracellular nuclease
LTYHNGDANPEAILIGLPLDDSANESVKLGDVLDNVNGIVTYSDGHYRILPKVAISIYGARTAAEGYSPMASSGDCAGLTVGQYNVNNLGAYSAHVVNIAEHIAIFMKSPDLVLLQEIMDNDGIGNTGAINSASTTLQVLRDAINSISGVYYHYTDIDPMDGQDGGITGGNIRNVFFYNPLVLQLAAATKGAGDAITPVDVAAGPVLTINPGRIDPTNPAFINSPKPIVAEFIVKNTLKHLFAVNVHSAPKNGSGCLTGDSHPPVNGGAATRLAQSGVIVDFVQKILTIDSSARVIVTGDFNENAGIESMDAYNSVLTNADDVFGTPIVERYTHRTEASMDKYDHTLLSSSLKTTVGNFRHFHVNTWTALPISPHDPSVLQLSVC